MSEWSERVTSSEAYGIIRGLIVDIDRLPAADDAATLESQDRLRRVIEHLGRRLDATDPGLVPPRTLGAAEAHLSAIRVAVDAYIDGHDASALDVAHSTLDQLLASSYFWVHEADPETEAAREAASRYRRSVGQLVRGVEHDAADARATVETLKAEAASGIAEVKAGAAEAIASVQASVQQVEGKLTELDQTVTTQKGRLDEAIGGFQTEFRKAEGSRTETFTQSVGRLTEAHSEFLRAERDRAAEAAADTSAQATAVLEEIRRHEEQARKVLGALGREGITGGHVNYANSQRLMAWIWSVVAVGALLLIFVYGWWLVASRPNAPIDWQWAVERVLVGGSMLLLAIYAMVQSNRYREAERYARQAELDLAALDPYMALLPPEEQQKLKIELAHRAFFQPPPQGESSQPPGWKDLVDITKEAIKR